MNKTETLEFSKPSRLQRVDFVDGMIVDADHLDAAVNYPVDLFKMLARAYFGCGIVCGLRYEVIGRWTLKIHPGTGLFCDGQPFEVCDPWTIDLSPEGCSRDEDEELCIAIGRPQCCSGARNRCNCSSEVTGGAERERLVVHVYPCDAKCPPEVCWVRDPTTRDDSSESDTKHECRCIKECPAACEGHDRSVFLGGLRVTRDRIAEVIKTEHRRYVKPIHCRCGPVHFNGPIDSPA